MPLSGGLDVDVLELLVAQIIERLVDEPLRDIGRLAFVEDHDAARTHVEQRPIVRREQDRGAGLVDVFEQTEDIDGELWVEVACRLVREDERRLVHDRARDGHSLLLAARQDARRVRPAAREAHSLERLADPRTNEALRQADHLERDRDVVVHAPARHQAEVLKHDADVSSKRGHRRIGQTRDVAPEEQDAPVVHVFGAMDEAKQGALSGARRTRNEDELSALDDERHPAQHRLIGAVRLVDVLEHQDGAGRGRRVVSVPRSERLVTKRAVRGGTGHRGMAVPAGASLENFSTVRGLVLAAKGDRDDVSVRMRIVFFGLPLAACLLHRDGHEIVLAALSRPDAPGRRRLHRLLGHGTVLDRPKLDDALLERVRGLRPELLVSWFWTNRIPSAFVGSAKQGAFGVHPSLLPRHRGPDPTSWAILSGDGITGVTAHRIADEYDTGAVLAQRELAIDPGWNAWQLAKALDRPSLAVLRDVCGRFARGEPPVAVSQDEAHATSAPFLEPDDERANLRWTKPTDELLRIIRALAPSPGAATTIGPSDVTVLRAVRCAVPAVLEEPGEAALLKGRVVVKTSDGAIELLEVEIGVDSALGDGTRTILRGAEIGALLAGS